MTSFWFEQLEEQLARYENSVGHRFINADNFIHINKDGEEIDVRTISDSYKKNLYKWYMERIDNIQIYGDFKDTQLMKYLSQYKEE